ncbi:protein lifeguard 1 isoform 1-T4 [Clarias gariepinus]|uniref:protein lifeguard 1 n=1 Tax=Clarias gariepinus TaxID=13013 RepID=UPI00234C2BD9|nr:protein lifeguard 1 [Clarias gariepinus]XP_053348188.1 protein lifeguard 1 [Clarias gariepinus]XP_053348197.1 protein lifeguard 1 [Clarias gariepinus]XP_053348206.1 protein lifeguard 1 [Clarias gariepinus]
MTDVEKQTSSEKMEGGDVEASLAPPPYPTDPASMQPPPYAAPPYPYGFTVYPTQPLEPPGEDVPPPVQDVNIQDLPAGGAAEDEIRASASAFISSAFDDKTVRKAFIRKVFSVVTLQLLVTFSVVCVFTFSERVKKAVSKNIWIYLSSYIIFVVVALALSFSSSLTRKHPWNLISLSVVTLSLSYMVGTVASFHDTPAVIIAMGATLVISFTIIIFSAQTRLDLTLCNGILLVLAVDLLMFGFFSIFFYSNILQVLYGSLGALLYAMFLAVDCQLVLGRDKYSLNPEEYVFAALIIYLDIITIFLYILILLGGSSKS